MDMDLYRACSDIVNQIPEGRVSTYGAVARALGDPVARRAVGVMLNTYKEPLRMPCHRVVYSTGELGGFAWGATRKVEMLAAEGVRVRNGRVAGFREIFFDDFSGDHPLKRARAYQEKLAGRVDVTGGGEPPDLILGLDASYDGLTAYGAGVLYDPGERRTVRVYGASMRVLFPYVPTYLAYREIPLYRMILEQVDGPAVLMVDGNGILHPRGIGIASHLGVEAGMPSLGIAKRKLCGGLEAEPGEVGEAQPVILNGRVAGHALRTSARAKPVFVSPGHLISHDAALELARRTARLKLPEPVRLAHAEAGRMRRSGQ